MNKGRLKRGTRRPSVIFMNRVYPPGRGATGRVLRDLARSFAHEGWQVTVLTTGPKAVRQRDGGVRVIRIKSPGKPGGIPGYVMLWLKMLAAGLRLSKADMLITLSDPPLLVIAGQIIRKAKGMRHINWCHDLYPDILPALDIRLPKFIMSFLKRLSRRAMKKADKLIVVGRCMARYLSEEGFDPAQIAMIPNWPDSELVGTPAVPEENGKKLNGALLGDNLLHTGPKFRVLYAGNLGRAHPIETIIEAAKILAADHPEIEFIFAGEGPRFDEVAKERERFHLDNVRLLPYQPANRLRQLMESGDLHLISVRPEAAGMLVPCKLYSALAVERPCIFIGPRLSEAAKVIRDFKAGSVVAQGQGRRLAEEIRRYRLSEQDWFAAHEGAARAGEIFIPDAAIGAWIERARGVMEQERAKTKQARRA